MYVQYVLVCSHVLVSTCTYLIHCNVQSAFVHEYMYMYIRNWSGETGRDLYQSIRYCVRCFPSRVCDGIHDYLGTGLIYLYMQQLPRGI
jgi:hypothetical protein